MSHHATRLAKAIAEDFYGGQGLKLPEQPPRKWKEMPEVRAVEELRECGADDRAVRLFLTFVAAMSRDRDFGQLLNAAVGLFRSERELYEPREAAEIHTDTLRDRLRESHVSRKHRPDAEAWATIANSLTQRNPVTAAINVGEGDALSLFWELDSLTGGSSRYPLLKGEKSGPLWLGWMAALGGARLQRLDLIPVAVDTHIRKASRAFGVGDLGYAKASTADPAIRAAWLKAVDGAAIAGPWGAAGTCAALNAPLWLLGKYDGCDYYTNLVAE